MSFRKRAARIADIAVHEESNALLTGGLQRVAGPTKVTVTTSSQTLAELGVTLNAATRGLILTVPAAKAEVIRWNYGAATANSCPLMAGTSEVEDDRDDLLSLEFITTSGTADMWVEEVG